MSDEVQGGPHLRRRPPNIVLVMLVYSVVASGGVLTVGNAATSSLFLARLPASAMPYLFLFPGLASALILLA